VAFKISIPDEGNGCYITSLSEMEVEKNDPIVLSVEDNELPEI
jgi:hypothetical protein